MPAGRPRKEVDEKQVEKLMAIQCTAEEIAGWFGVSVDTIDRRIKEWGYPNFAEMFKQFSQDGKISLRRAQYKVATEKLNVAMLIWLGKQYLGQSDYFIDEHKFDEPETPTTLKAV